INLDEIEPDEVADFVSECAANGKTPLAFKTEDREKLETALFAYTGVACVFAEGDMQDVCEKFGAHRVSG
ncbi:MAG: hypothetical protein II266_03310, partial [Clostridia bacterium]|nr:hypothetical protein [Clostridia bacterium]